MTTARWGLWRRIAAEDRGEDLLAWHLGHAQIEEHSVELVAFEQSESLRAGRGGSDLEPPVAELDAQGLPDRALIVDQEDAPARRSLLSRHG